MSPSISSIHPIVWIAAFSFQVINATQLAGFLAGYGPIDSTDWADRHATMATGLVVFVCGLIGNIYHDDELYRIRRVAAGKMKERERTRSRDEGIKEGWKNVYSLPENGLFKVILYPHYFCEWVEWIGYWIIGGLRCVPARNFVVNEVATMLPLAMYGKRWYIERFGKEKIGNRKAAIPGII